MARKTGQLMWRAGPAGKGFYLLMTVMAILVGWGIFAYSQQLGEGLVVTGMRDIGIGGAAWGMYIAFDIYFVGASFAGITIAALIRLFNLKQLQVVARMAELLTIITLLLAALIIVVDLGQPLRGIVGLFRYARPMSPFFGTFALVLSGYLFASLVFFYLDGRRDAAICSQQPGRWQWFYRLWAAGYKGTSEEKERHDRVSWWLSLTIVPLLIVAHSTLGLIFGIQAGRPGWFSALQAPGFVILAGASGMGLLIIIAAILRSTLKVKDRLPMKTFAWLGNFTWVFIISYLYFTVIELLAGVYAAPSSEANVFQQLLTGDYSALFWISMAFFLISLGILFGQFLLKRYSLGLMVTAGVLVNLAAIGKRFLIVVPSQTHGSLLPYSTGTYNPTWVEYSVIIGIFALGILAYALFTKLFPLVELQEGE